MYYTAQYKTGAYVSWTNIGRYSSEGMAMTEAQKKKNGGAFAAMVIDDKGNVIYSL
jgi:hypothetical protein